MKKFTVKDFITYNNPCFSCGEAVTIKIVTRKSITTGRGSKSDEEKNVEITPLVTPEYVEMNLRITYKKTLKLKIFHKTNKFKTNDEPRLLKFLTENDIWIESFCSCLTYIKSECLRFDLTKEFIYSFPIENEVLSCSDNINWYVMASSFKENKSALTYGKKDYSLENNWGADSIGSIVLPLLPRYRFRNKEHFLTKMKTYLIFS
jgi:hypothetical protein